MLGFFQSCLLPGKGGHKPGALESPKQVPWENRGVFSPEKNEQWEPIHVNTQSTVDTEDEDLAADFLVGLELAKSDDEMENGHQQISPNTITQSQEPIVMLETTQQSFLTVLPKEEAPESDEGIDENQAPPRPVVVVENKNKPKFLGIHQRALAAKKKRGKRPRPVLQAK